LVAAQAPVDVPSTSRGARARTASEAMLFMVVNVGSVDLLRHRLPLQSQ
jgi:hypothetical protein